MTLMANAYAILNIMFSSPKYKWNGKLSIIISSIDSINVSFYFNGSNSSQTSNGNGSWLFI